MQTQQHPFGSLAPYRQRAIPDLSEALSRKVGYRNYSIDFAHANHHEECVEIRTLGLVGKNHYAHVQNPPYYSKAVGSTEGLFLRITVAEKIAKVNERLKKYDLELWVFDAWRPIQVQNYFHDIFMPNFLRNGNPNLKGEALWKEVELYWAKGAADGKIDPTSPPPHSTGAAVDLTIRHRTGEHLYLGSIFDDVTKRGHTNFYEDDNNVIDRSFSDSEARANRRLLYWLMIEEGFSNNPTEWWHFSWGDQMWAKLKGEGAAIYSVAAPGSAS